MRFPLLAGQGSAPTACSMEEDTHCMSFAQVSLRRWGGGKKVLCGSVHDIVYPARRCCEMGRPEQTLDFGRLQRRVPTFY